MFMEVVLLLVFLVVGLAIIAVVVVDFCVALVCSIKACLFFHLRCTA